MNEDIEGWTDSIEVMVLPSQVDSSPQHSVSRNHLVLEDKLFLKSQI